MPWGPNCIAKTEEEFKANRRAYFKKWYARNRVAACKRGGRELNPWTEWDKVNTRRLMATKSTEEFEQGIKRLLAGLNK